MISKIYHFHNLPILCISHKFVSPMFSNKLAPYRNIMFEQFALTIPQCSEIKQTHCRCACAKHSNESTVTSPQTKFTVSKLIHTKEMR